MVPIRHHCLYQEHTPVQTVSWIRPKKFDWQIYTSVEIFLPFTHSFFLPFFFSQHYSLHSHQQRKVAIGLCMCVPASGCWGTILMAGKFENGPKCIMLKKIINYKKTIIKKKKSYAEVWITFWKPDLLWIILNVLTQGSSEFIAG